MTSILDCLAKPDPRTSNWFYFNSSFHVIIVVGAYLVFVLNLGPKYMKDSPPLGLRMFLVYYDLVQVLGCLFIVLATTNSICHMNWRCGEIAQATEHSPEPLLCVLYHFLKVLDLLETVFHLLNNRDDHVTLPHIYHHSVMVMLSWLMVRYAPGGHSMLLPFINSFINFFNYSAYLLSAYDKKRRRCLFWRDHLPQIQFIQFAAVLLLYIQPLLTPGCKYPKGILMVGLSQLLFMILSSIYFYQKYYMD